MLYMDYDEFNIYTTFEDVENYIEILFSQGFELKDEIYNKCLGHFGVDFKHLLDRFFYDED